jgi:phytol kinase
VTPLEGLGAIAVTAAILLGLILLAERSVGLPAEVLRKLVHLVTGSLSILLPWIFRDTWPVLVLAGVAAGGMIALRVFPTWLAWIREAGFARSLRLDSLGDVTFPLGIAGLFVLAHDDRVRYAIPLLVATYADAAAAVTGKQIGRNRFTPPFGGAKTVEGSLAFLVTAFACFVLPLTLQAGALTPTLIAVSLGGAVLTTILEAVSWSGLDNLFLPFGTWGYLYLFVPQQPLQTLGALFK